jgi:hypothetical protein
MPRQFKRPGRCSSRDELIAIAKEVSRKTSLATRGPRTVEVVVDARRPIGRAVQVQFLGDFEKRTRTTPLGLTISFNRDAYARVRRERQRSVGSEHFAVEHRVGE